MSNCKVATKKETMIINADAVAYDEASKSAIESFIGSKDDYTGNNLKMYNKTYKLLYNFFDKNSLVVHSVTTPQAFIDNIKEYSLKSTGNLRVKNSEKTKYHKKESLNVPSVNYSAYAMTGIYNRTRKILRRIEKSKGNIGKYSGMLRDPFMVGLLYDSGGVMNKLINYVQSFSDRREQRFLSQINNISDSKNSFKSKLEDLFSQNFNDEKINDYIADGLDGFVTHNNEKVTILKVENTTEGNGENSRITVRYKSGSKKDIVETVGVTFYPEGKFTDKFRKSKSSKVGILMKKNVAEQIKNALKNKYSNTVFSEIANGQIRYIEAGGNPTDDDFKVIKRMLKEDSIRYESNDANKFGYFHKIRSNGWTIEYVMVKQPEGKGNKEVYKAYIVSKVLTEKEDLKEGSGKYYFYNRHIKTKEKNNYEYVKSRDFSGHKSLAELGLLDNGYYRSDKQDSFGTVINEYYRSIPGSVNKQWMNFKKINSDSFYSIVSMKSFWDIVTNYRKEIATVPEIVDNSYVENVVRNEKVKKYLNSINDKSGKIKLLIKQLGINDLNKYVLYEKKQNYFPNMPDKEMRQKILMEEIENLKDKLANEDNQEVADYYRNTINELLGKSNKDNYEDEEILSQVIAFLKHRNTALYGQDIRKDDGVIRDYFHFTSHMIEKNNTKSLLIEAIMNIIKNNGNKIDGVETQIDYLIKKSKQAFGDIDVDLPFPFISNKRFASLVTRFVNTFDKDYKMSPDDAARIIKNIKSVITSITLGSRGAKKNRFQSVSAVIPFGLKYWKDARRALDVREGEPNKWRDRLLYYGTGNVFSQLNDMVFLGGESSPMDVGFFEAGRIKIPTKNMKEWTNIHKAGRKAFIEQETFLDKFFPPLAERRLKRFYKSFTNLEQKAKNEKIKNEIRYLKRIYWDLFFADEKQNNEANLKKLF